MNKQKTQQANELTPGEGRQGNIRLGTCASDWRAVRMHKFSESSKKTVERRKVDDAKVKQKGGVKVKLCRRDLRLLVAVQREDGKRLHSVQNTEAKSCTRSARLRASSQKPAQRKLYLHARIATKLVLAACDFKAGPGNVGTQLLQWHGMSTGVAFMDDNGRSIPLLFTLPLGLLRFQSIRVYSPALLVIKMTLEFSSSECFAWRSTQDVGVAKSKTHASFSPETRDTRCCVSRL
eukprot:6189943-Pleurochrysis_carterae.AAC.1